MLIQINTDNNIEGSEEVAGGYSAVLQSTLKRFSEKITRLEVHLSDGNSHKDNPDNKRCMLEARVKGMQPMAVTHEADSLDIAVSGAAEKMKRSLETTFGKMRNY